MEGGPDRSSGLAPFSGHTRRALDVRAAPADDVNVMRARPPLRCVQATAAAATARFRLWTEREQNSLRDFERPEIERVDLSEAFIRGVESAERRPTRQEAPTIKMTSGTMSYLGVVPDYSGGVEGLRLTAINPNSPAEKAGLLAGDIVVQMGRYCHDGGG